MMPLTPSPSDVNEKGLAGGSAPSLGHGLIASPVAGRTDRLPVHAAPDSYIIPADVVSGLGQGNTMAGERILDAMFQPYAGKARGGTVQNSGVPIIVAGGEYAVNPGIVAAIGGGDPKKGHATLDKMVVGIRKQTIKQLSKLPGPVK